MYEEWDPGKTYVQGDTISYDGSLWTAKWWNQASRPGESDAWSHVGRIVTGDTTVPGGTGTGALGY